MSTELFDSYETEYSSLVDSIRQRLDSVLPELVGQERRQAIQTTEHELTEALELAEQLEVELLSLPGPVRTRAAPRVRRYKEDVAKLRQDTRRAAQGMGNHEANRRALLGDHHAGAQGGSGSGSPLGYGDDGGAFSGLESDQRSRLLSGNERLARGSQRLQDSHRIAVETESIGANILNDLRSQREQIINTRDTLMQADSHIDRSQRTLRTMARRLMTNKMISMGIIIVGVSLVLLILYVKLIR
ncbi:Vesicle transport V-snare protein [Coemansia sp. Benny D115]|nr:Vesicle transport V-snare protein [Coemansia sp. Benny D115]